MNRIGRSLMALVALPLALSAASCAKPAQAETTITVYKSPTCGCCANWVEHLEEHGFKVTVVDNPDLAPVKQQHGVPTALQSCHTAVVEGYAVEGHVPADVIRRLLAERPAVKGIAVPGMPVGSPGMEMGDRKDPYEVYTFDENGPKDVFEVR
jgi:hypothetical protein